MGCISNLKLNLVLSFCSIGMGRSITVTQLPPEYIAVNQSSMHINCFSKDNIQYIYWYRQPQGQGLELIASIARYDIEKPDMVSGYFTISTMTAEDAAVYFCAATEHNDMLLPHLHSKTDTLRCLMVPAWK
uniref:Ig-like domain-containing protein n=1 Tax=Paramormyrops kingsleyae TaxID=1676925 RepID=A0A3B3SA83_9TELE